MAVPAGVGLGVERLGVGDADHGVSAVARAMLWWPRVWPPWPRTVPGAFAHPALGRIGPHVMYCAF
ncbi:hypothetical protein [Micromonospora carbonacea]|uniref:hypothetical protein n=1 Tax=Micromonospora carbonacea TaxID=47853 RepID=UPI00114CCDE4|nr:hypothetical protein [Micromonospora carbonacea]